MSVVPTDIERYNRDFYERCWRAGSLLPMPGVEIPAGPLGLRVEIGCGLRPRLPLTEAVFVDVSPTACRKLRRAGAPVICGRVESLPFRDGAVTQIAAFDLLEHLEDDRGAVRELARVVATGGTLVLSAPLHAHAWQEFDRLVGHARRYEPDALVALLVSHGFTLEAFAPFGVRPRSSLLNRLGAYYLRRWPRIALWFSERFLVLFRPAAPAFVSGDVRDFVRGVSGAVGAVTAWRREADGASPAQSLFNPSSAATL